MMLKMCIQIRGNWKMLIFLAFFPIASKVETTLPKGVKTIEEREVCPEKEKKLYHGISLRTTDTCMINQREERKGSDF